MMRTSLLFLVLPFGEIGFSSIVWAQQDFKSHLKPITSPVRHAGVYHLGTGTWTRNASLSNMTGPDVIYNNTCAGKYFVGTVLFEQLQHRSRIPSPSGPTTPTVVPGQAGNDEAPGSQTSYVVNGFQIAYCSSSPSNVTWRMQFADSYAECSNSDMVPTQTFDLPGLPGGTSTGSQICWVIDVDLAAGGLSFTAMADGDGTYVGPSTQEQFGWSWEVLTSSGLGTGPIVAGDYTWTGGPATGPLTPCKGTDGTIWDCPTNLAEEGTGMVSNDFFRDTNVNQPFCTSFGGKPHSDFHLKLFAAAPSAHPMTSFCHPGQVGIVLSCPCANPPAEVGSGCNNSASTGGAMLCATGAASIAADTVVFTTSGERPIALSILMQGTTNIPAGTVFGQGVRCVGGSLKRLYRKSASGGSIHAPTVGDQSVSARSAALGDPLSSGVTRYYLVYYRDPTILGGCPRASTFNATQGGIVSWGL